MKKVFDPDFNIKNKLLSLGFIHKDKEREDVYIRDNDSERHGKEIIIYLHHYYSVLEKETICTSMSVFIDNERIYLGMRPYCENGFNYLYSNLFPSLEYSEKIQHQLNEQMVNSFNEETIESMIKKLTQAGYKISK